MFLTSPNIKLDWAPGAWLYNKLSIDSLTAERVSLIRLPKLKPSTKKGPILPGFDIHVGELRIDRLDIGRAGRRQAREAGACAARPTCIRAARWSSLQALINNGGDRIAFHLDAEPDRNKFDVRARDRSPANGLVPAMIGTNRAINLDDRRQGQLDALARAAPHSTSPAGRQRGSRSASTAAAIGSRAHGRRRSSSPASFSG